MKAHVAPEAARVEPVALAGAPLGYRLLRPLAAASLIAGAMPMRPSALVR